MKKLVRSPARTTTRAGRPTARRSSSSRRWASPDFFHANSRLAVVPADGGTPRSLTDAFDEDPNLVDWTSRRHLFLGPAEDGLAPLPRRSGDGKAITRVSQPDTLMAFGFSLSRDGRQLAFTRRLADVADRSLRRPTRRRSRRGKLTDMTAAAGVVPPRHAGK